MKKILLIIFAAFLVVGAGYYIYQLKLVPAKIDPNQATYTDSEYNFTITYPKNFFDLLANINRIATRVNLLAPSTRTPYTGDIEIYKYNYFGGIKIEAFENNSAHPISEADCKVIEQNQKDKASDPVQKRINGISFFSYTVNSSQDWYKTYRNGVCYWIHVYTKDASTLTDARAAFEPVLKSFRFTR